MSDKGTAGHRHLTATVRGTATVPEAHRPHPVSMVVLNTVTGTVTAANPAARRLLSGTSGLQLSRWLARVATATTAGDGPTRVYAWRGVDGESAAPVRLWAQCTAITYRSHPSLHVVLREDHVPAAADAGGTAADPNCAVFTLDAVGRVDFWGAGAQRITGFVPDRVLGSDTTLLHPGPARLAGEPHRALTDAYRHGEHRAEGWRVCSDGRVIWAQVITCALYDGLDRLLGFATVLQDLTALRRLTGPTRGAVPGPRGAGPTAAADAGSAVRSPVPSVRSGLRVPGQRRAANT